MTDYLDSLIKNEKRFVFYKGKDYLLKDIRPDAFFCCFMAELFPLSVIPVRIELYEKEELKSIIIPKKRFLRLAREKQT